MSSRSREAGRLKGRVSTCSVFKWTLMLWLLGRHGKSNLFPRRRHQVDRFPQRDAMEHIAAVAIGSLRRLSLCQRFFSRPRLADITCRSLYQYKSKSMYVWRKRQQGMWNTKCGWRFRRVTSRDCLLIRKRIESRTTGECFLRLSRSHQGIH